MKAPLAILFSTPLAFAAPLPLAIGTQSGGSGLSEGIYRTTFDPSKGSFTEVKLAAKYPHPGFLALHPKLPLLYSVGKTEQHPKGSVAVFKITERLEFLAEASSGGTNPCHLAIDPTGQVLAVANYADGITATLKLDRNGLPTGPGFAQRVEGSGPRADRQDGPHAHGVYFRGGTLLVPDLGLDKVLTWHLDLATATPSGISTAVWSAAPGAGPRHMDFSPDGKHAYVINELDNSVSACAFEASTGGLTTLHSLPTLPTDWTGKSTTAEIQVHPNGKLVYASNRGHDSIAAFSRDPATGKLSPLGVFPCGGKTPRHFTISPDGKWLLCAHQDSNSIAALPLDPATGKLGAPSTTINAPNPICLLFLPADS
ncbi:MAG: lactonase family protein [Verrucomicrobia bacterium]|nr:MAG: lactonase family protein [Verrucomicrobiota bacterium]TAE89308.1 MAG: lactonase family protein [Verrucomicrobiota bacterium]TAF27816.1 MAG: lactonase family protein [Verrucomicrobiota bacterium]TAF42665.1 MAG: lactonase family protein [Verrucomicrobiota bacterium]